MGTKGSTTTVSSLVPLVKRLAGRFRRDYWSPSDREDIVQEGFIGLMEAAGRFEPDRGCSLSTFAGQRVIGAMVDHVRVICRRSRERVTDETPQDQLHYRMEHGETNAPASAESGVMLLRFRDFLGSDLSGLEFLDDDERGIIRMRFFEGLSCREVANVLGVSAATVCRVERTALVRLRKNFVLRFCGPAAASRPSGAGTSGAEIIEKDRDEDTEDIPAKDNSALSLEDVLASLAL